MQTSSIHLIPYFLINDTDNNTSNRLTHTTFVTLEYLNFTQLLGRLTVSYYINHTASTLCLYILVNFSRISRFHTVTIYYQVSIHPCTRLNIKFHLSLSSLFSSTIFQSSPREIQVQQKLFEMNRVMKKKDKKSEQMRTHHYILNCISSVGLNVISK